MDTDDLSDEVYNGVILEAENFLHELAIHYGFLASKYSNEFDYLIAVKKLNISLRKLKSTDYLDLFWGKTPTVASFHKVLSAIMNNIKEIEKIPIHRRKFTRWGRPKYVCEMIENLRVKNLYRS